MSGYVNLFLFIMEIRSRMKPFFSHVKALIIIFIILFLIVNFTSCSKFNLKKTENKAEYNNWALIFQENDVKSKISYLEEKFKTESDYQKKLDILIHLSLLYIHHNNPEPDYPKALNALKMYVSLNQEDEQKDDVAFLILMINNNNKLYTELNNSVKELVQDKKLKDTQLQQLKKHNMVLEKKFENLAKENKRLEEMIDKFKKLDIWLEKERKKTTF